jgi:hypothetical protein
MPQCRQYPAAPIDVLERRLPARSRHSLGLCVHPDSGHPEQQSHCARGRSSRANITTILVMRLPRRTLTPWRRGARRLVDPRGGEGVNRDRTPRVGARLWGCPRPHVGECFRYDPGLEPGKTCDDRLRAHRSERSRAKREVGHPEPAQPQTHAGISHAGGEVDDVVDRFEGGPQPTCWMVAHEATVGEAAPAVRGRLALRSSRHSSDAPWTHPAFPPLSAKTWLLNSIWVRNCPPLITWLKYAPGAPCVLPKI